MALKVIKGTVVSIAGEKSTTISVERRVMHPRYKKIVKKYKKYVVHDEKNDTSVGDIISAIECRPLSKRKSFRLSEILVKGVA